MKSYPLIQSGQWVGVGMIYKMACCDCGLVHVLEFKIKDGLVHMRAFRNMKSTSALRRNRNYPCNP